MKIEHLQHKLGGRIVEISAAEHETYKGVASWYFAGSVIFDDSKTQEPQACQLAPWVICADQDNPSAKAEAEAIFAALTAHMEMAGQWHDAKHKRDGRVYSWTPFKLKGSTPI
jgi:hypothetical protein